MTGVIGDRLTLASLSLVAREELAFGVPGYRSNCVQHRIVNHRTAR